MNTDPHNVFVTPKRSTAVFIGNVLPTFLKLFIPYVDCDFLHVIFAERLFMNLNSHCLYTFVKQNSMTVNCLITDFSVSSNGTYRLFTRFTPKIQNAIMKIMLNVGTKTFLTFVGMRPKNGEKRNCLKSRKYKFWAVIATRTFLQKRSPATYR